MAARAWKAGLALSLAAAALWGFLPIVVKGALREVDPLTTTWVRFAGSAVILGAWLAVRQPSSLKPALGTRRAWLLPLAVLCMSANTTLFVYSLAFQSPSVSQTVLQLGPPLVFIGGAVLFREPVSRVQWAGFAMLLLGLALFFNTKLPFLVSGRGPQTLGVVLVLLSACGFAGYSLSQKALLPVLRPETTLFWALVGGACLLTPLAAPARILQASPTGWLLLVLAVLHTVLPFFCFGQALRLWETSRVGAIVALPPLVTALATGIVARLIPDYVQAEGLNLLSCAGIALVVAGCMSGALGRPASHPRPQGSRAMGPQSST